MARILSHQLHKRLLPLYQSILIKPLSQSNLTLVQCLDITNAVRREQHLRASERVLRLERKAHLAAIAMERHKRIERIRFLAMHDPLTGLPNRSLLNEHLGRNLRRAHREGHQFALMFIDLDGFNQINDLHGHDAGDDLLSVLSGRITEQLRGTDTCARIGGDQNARQAP